jgi:hypothetical protein
MRFGLSLPHGYPALAERVIAREIHLLRSPQTSCTRPRVQAWLDRTDRNDARTSCATPFDFRSDRARPR